MVYNSGAMPLLRQALLDTYLIRLRTIARFWGIPLTGSGQREVALELTQAMSRPGATQRVLDDLSEDEWEALQALLASEGRMPARVFSREWGEIRAMGPGRMERELPWEHPASPAESLWYRGLLFQSFERGPDGAYEVFFIPVEIRSHLPSPGNEQSAITLEPVEAPNHVISGQDLLLDDACTLLTYVHNHHPWPDLEHGWPASHKQRLLQRLRCEDPARLTFLDHLARRIGWLRDEEAERLRLHAEAVTTWLQSDPRDQRRAVVETWRDDPTWNDLFHVPSLEPEDTGAWRNDPLLPRRALLRHIRACTPTDWYEMEDFVKAIKEADPDFQRPDGHYDSWYIRDSETKEYLTGFESWDNVEGRLIRHLLSRPMTWLGLIELGAESPNQRIRAFRLSEEGAIFLDLAEPSPPPPGPAPARLQPGFLVSLPASRRYERFQLSRVAEWIQSGERFLYRLTPRSLGRARRQGIPLARVLKFVEEITEAPAPRPVKKALNRWGIQGVEVSIQDAVLLRLSDEELMNRILDSPRLKKLVDERIGPTAAVIEPQDWPELVVQLEALGLLPDVRIRSK